MADILVLPLLAGETLWESSLQVRNIVRGAFMHVEAFAAFESGDRIGSGRPARHILSRLVTRSLIRKDRRGIEQAPHRRGYVHQGHLGRVSLLDRVGPY